MRLEYLCIFLCPIVLGDYIQTTTKSSKNSKQTSKPPRKSSKYVRTDEIDVPRDLPKEPWMLPPPDAGVPLDPMHGLGLSPQIWPPHWPYKPPPVLPETRPPRGPKRRRGKIKPRERRKYRKYPHGLEMLQIPGKVKRVKALNPRLAVENQFIIKVWSNATDRDVFKAFAHARMPYPKHYRFGVNCNLLWLKNINEKQLEELEEHTEIFELIEPDLITNVSCSTYDASGIYRWGLDRLDNMDLQVAFDSSFKMTATGNGVDIYVVDTGINKDHEDFGSRVTYGYSISSTAADDNGHGTHVAGILGGAKYGVAKDANIVSVKVIHKDGTGTVSDFLSGIQWIQDQVGKRKRKSVVNVSLRWPHSDSANSAVEGLVKDGIIVVTAAGNDGGDACQYSPASEPLAICVGATDWLDYAVSSYNVGPCVDIYAPGSNIESAWHTDRASTMVQSGTSTATPFVTGAAAVYLSSLPDEIEPSGNLATKVATFLFSASASSVYFDFVNATLAPDCANRLLQITC